jgi:hypothetical protein
MSNDEVWIKLRALRESGDATAKAVMLWINDLKAEVDSLKLKLRPRPEMETVSRPVFVPSGPAPGFRKLAVEPASTLTPPTANPAGWDAEGMAVAATRAANGLPRTPDAAVTGPPPADMPAGYYHKTNKMGDAAGNKE